MCFDLQIANELIFGAENEGRKLNSVCMNDNLINKQINNVASY